jgi:DnaK suppressor protein
MSPGVEQLDQEFLTQQRGWLAEHRRAQAQLIEALTAEIRNHVQRREAGAPTEGFGSGEIASVQLERARSELSQARTRLGEIDAAIARLDAGTYGVCQLCGQSIGRDRLEAIPTVTRCIDCQARLRRS